MRRRRSDSVSRPLSPLCCYLPLLVLLINQPLRAQIHFVERGAAAGVHDPINAGGAAFGDVDADGWPDLLVTWASREPARLWRNLGDGTFADDAFDWSPAPFVVGGLFVDDDGDGDQDIYLVRFEGADEMHRNEGGGALRLAPPAEGFVEHGAATGAFFADLDRDGRAELFTSHRSAEANQWIHRPGSAAARDLGVLMSPLRSGNNTFSTTPFDYDGDGDLDLYVCSFGSSNLLHRNDGAGVFRTLADAAGMASPRASVAALPADPDGDGDLDLYLVNAVAHPNQLFVHPGARGSAFEDRAEMAGVADGGNSAAANWADFDNDGDADLMVANVEATVRVYANDGRGQFEDVSTSAIAAQAQPVLGTIALAIADVDRDGDVDAYLAAPQSHGLLLLNDSGDGGGGGGAGGDANDWLRIDLGQVASHAGTKVTVSVGDRRQVREFSVTSALGSQRGGHLHFGLGATSTESAEVVVDWASGQRQTLSSAVNRVLPLQEPAPARDVAVTRVVAPGPAPGLRGFAPQVVVANRGRLASAAGTLELHIDAGTRHTQQLPVPSLAPGDSLHLVFDHWQPSIAGSADVAFVLTADDDVSANNRWQRRYELHAFAEVAARRGVADDGFGWAGALGDYDSDGDLDLYVSNGGTSGAGANRLFRNDGALFTDVTDAAGVGDVDNGTGVTFADFDGDGRQDLFIAKGGFDVDGEANRLFHNDGDGSFSDITGEAGLDAVRSSYAAVVGDWDRDGHLDLYVSQLRGQEATFYRNVGGHFEDVTQAKAIQSFFRYSGSAGSFSDYDNDGDTDLYAGIFGDFDRFYADVDGGAYAVSAVGGNGEMVGVAVADYDEDGDVDIYTVNMNGRSALYRNEISALRDVGAQTGTENLHLGTGCAFVDYDSDGDLDLLVANLRTANRVFANLGDGIFVDHAQAFGLADTARARAVLVGDVDGDGHPDAYVINEGTDNLLYLNGGSRHHWLQASVRGVVSNTDGIGARLTAHAGDRTWMREVNGTSGMSYSSRVTHFGLGAVERLDSLVVTWPSGIRDVHYALATNHAVDLVEGGPLTAVTEVTPAPRPIAFELDPVHPNPFNASVVLRYHLADAGVIHLTVHNALGQGVRRLLDGMRLPPGAHQGTWDGRDDRGRAAASGVYFARLRSGGRLRVRPMVLLR